MCDQEGTNGDNCRRPSSFQAPTLLLESPVSLSAASLQSKLKLSIISANHSGRFKGRGPSFLVFTTSPKFFFRRILNILPSLPSNIPLIMPKSPRASPSSLNQKSPTNDNSRLSDIALRKKKNADAQAAFRARRNNYIITLEATG